MADPGPLEVDWLDGLDQPTPGRLGMSMLPGRKGNSFHAPPLRHERSLVVDLRRLRQLGVVRLVLLVENRELEDNQITDVMTLAPQFGIRVIRRPIRDLDVPDSPGWMDEILRRIAEALGIGNVVVACLGGYGRTGTVVACALVARGWDPDLAIAEVRRKRGPYAVETVHQEAFVRAYAAHRAAVLEGSASEGPGD